MAQGLTAAQVKQQQAQDGFNEVKETPFSFTRAVTKRLWEPSAWLLELALLLEIILGKEIQAGFIVLMLLFAAVNGAIQEKRANTVLRTLTQDLSAHATVLRDGRWTTIPARELVVGDQVDLRAGELVPADVRLTEGSLQLDESTITGEALAISRTAGDTAFSGTTVTSGQATGQVSAIGAMSRAGKTVTLLNRSAAPGHLQQLLGRIIRDLAILDSILTVILIIASLVHGQTLIPLLPFIAMLFIATIPIAMPSSFAVANSVEAKVLSKQQILVSELTGIQNAAELDVLLVDKTGTLTQNRPTVVAMSNLSTRPTAEIAQLAVLACDQQHPSVVDRAIRAYAADRKPLVATRDAYLSFSPDTGFAEATITIADQPHTVRLGALAVLHQADPTTELPPLAETSGRTVALAIDGTVSAIFTLADTLRTDSQAAIATLATRGVQVVMLTGDAQHTAATVAHQVGLTGEVVALRNLPDQLTLTELAGIAEVRPEDKLAIVQRLQAAGHIVGMTGDGVNDAPALKQAEVGIAVHHAVDVAKRAASFVLMRDGLTPLTDILDSGHRVYQRMMTWTITKLSRTAELTILLTLGAVLTGRIPLSLNAMILVAILNDLVTLVLGTDRTTITHQPERWHMTRLATLGGLLATGWTLVGGGLMYWASSHFTVPQQSTVLFTYLIFSAMLTITMTRTTKAFWLSRPSRAVCIAICVNCLLTVALAVTGCGVAQIGIDTILAILGVVLVTGIVLTPLLRWARSSD